MLHTYHALKGYTESSRRSEFQKVIKYVHWMKTDYVQSAVNLSKIFFFFCNTGKFLHAHLQYVCNITAKYQMNILKAIGGVDFTKYALLPISQYVRTVVENCLS